MKLSKKQIKKIILESVYASKNMQRLSYSHEKWLDRQKEKEFMKSSEYRDNEMIKFASYFFEVYTETPLDNEEIAALRDDLGTDDIDDIINIFKGIIKNLESIK